jgi:hypothetical protein
MREAYAIYACVINPPHTRKIIIGRGVFIQLDIIHVMRTAVGNQGLIKQIGRKLVKALNYFRKSTESNGCLRR